MKERVPLPDNHLTVDDFFIWAGHAMQFEHLRYPFSNPSLLPADRRDADLMLVVQEIVQFGESAIQINGIDCRGWTQHESLK